MRIYDIAYFDKLLLRSSIQITNGIQCNALSLEQTRVVYKDSKTF